MAHMERGNKDIEDHFFKDGKEYDRLLISQSFFDKLEEEVKERNLTIDLPNLEV